MADSDRAPEIEVEDLVIRFGAVAAVGPVNFSVTRGEQLTLLGPSGCGKTTTLRAIAGLERPTAGAIRIRGETVYDASRRISVPAERRGLSMVFQSYAIWPHMTVFENVAYGLRVRNASAAETEEKVHACVHQVRQHGVRDVLVRGDVSSEDDVVAMFEQTVDQLFVRIRRSVVYKLRHFGWSRRQPM